MGIHEFEEVGSAIREFASDDATVVVGTVIDPDMTDEIRVTIVVTGLDAGNASTAAAAPQRQATTRLRPVQIEQTARKVAGSDVTPAPAAEPKAASGKNYLDIPAFLRNQAD